MGQRMGKKVQAYLGKIQKTLKQVPNKIQFQKLNKPYRREYLICAKHGFVNCFFGIYLSFDIWNLGIPGSISPTV